MQKTEDHGYEKKRGDGCQHQTADYRSAKWRILLATIAETKGHWYHTNDNRRGSHDNRA
jgi:hypothetical protein